MSNLPSPRTAAPAREAQPDRPKPRKTRPLQVNGGPDRHGEAQDNGRAAKPKDRQRVAGIDEAAGSVGSRLKYLRQTYGLSIRELARRSGLSHGTVGCIEKDSISPSVGSLRKILDSFPITLSEFFSIDLSLDQQVFYSHDELLEVGGEGVSLKQVGRNLKSRPLQVLLEHYEPGAETAGVPYSHSGEEGGVVIRGRIELTVGGQTRVLGPGDAYLFPSRLPHRFRNADDGISVVVSANTPPL